MAGSVCRVGDRNNAGGVILNGDSSVLVNGRAIAITDAKVSPHPTCGQKGGARHCSATTTTKSSQIFVNGKPVVLVGDRDTCGHTRQAGSPDVKVG